MKLSRKLQQEQWETKVCGCITQRKKVRKIDGESKTRIRKRSAYENLHEELVGT